MPWTKYMKKGITTMKGKMNQLEIRKSDINIKPPIAKTYKIMLGTSTKQCLSLGRFTNVRILEHVYVS
jgi:hypothetical protein